MKARPATYLIAVLSALVPVGCTGGAQVVKFKQPLQQTGLPDRIFLSSAEQRKAVEAGLLPEYAQSVLNVSRQLRHGDFVWSDRGVAHGEISVRVNLRDQLISVFRGPHEIGTAVVLYGTSAKKTPRGLHRIWAKKTHNVSTIYGAPMPYTMRLTGDGIAIHGSAVGAGKATHGCVGVPLEFAEHLYRVSTVGTPVEIT